jgi:NAD(P)-dependent dehydrogenase (short-subunit alcohol dehydrogenase family)
LTRSRMPLTYFVTGASSGIGLEIVRALHARGATVIATGRRAVDELTSVFPDIPYHPANLADVTARNRLLAAIPASLDRAILCAGQGYYRPLKHETAQDIAAVVEVNLTAPLHLAHGLYGPLSSTSGRIAFVGSVARKGAGSMPVYASTKAALDGLARSLALEWEGRIAVKALHPGPTATDMSVRAGRPADVMNRLMLSPVAVADAIVEALESDGDYRRTISYGRILMDKLWRRPRA